MARRTVRLDDETKKILDQLVHATGLSISAVLKKGLLTLQERLEAPSGRPAWDLYEELDLGPGGYSSAPSSESRQGVVAILRRKHGR